MISGTLSYAYTLLELHGANIRIRGRANVPRRFPDLQNVVVCRRGDVPLSQGAPRQIADPGRVSSVDEQQLGRSVFSIIRRLLLPNRGKVPDMHAAVCAGRGEVNGGVRGPSDLQDVVGV